MPRGSQFCQRQAGIRHAYIRDVQSSHLPLTHNRGCTGFDRRRDIIMTIHTATAHGHKQCAGVHGTRVGGHRGDFHLR